MVFRVEKKRNGSFTNVSFGTKLIILDEIDSGLDIDAIQAGAQAINFLKKENKLRFY
jgi:Fe-S cluster assembly ATPase SufC